MRPGSTLMLMEIGALLLAFLGLFALATIPVVNLGVAPFVPLPLCAIFMRHGVGGGLLGLAILAVVLVGLLPAPEQLYCLPFALAGTILGWLGRRTTSALKIVAAGAASTTLLLTALFYGYNFYAASTARVPTTAAWIDSLHDPAHVAASLSSPPATPAARAMDRLYFWLSGEHASDTATRVQKEPDADWLQKNKESREFLLRVDRFPVGLLFLGSCFYFTLVYFAAAWLLPRWGMQLPAFDGFRLWRLPWTLAWLPILCFAAYSLSRLLHFTLAEFVSDSLLIMTLVPYMVLAFSISAYWIEKLRLDPLLAAMAYSLLFLNLKPLAVLAIFDAWIDFRRLESGKEHPPACRQEGNDWDDIDF